MAATMDIVVRVSRERDGGQTRGSTWGLAGSVPCRESGSEKFARVSCATARPTRPRPCCCHAHPTGGA
eukprot:4323387-Pyramimonas_sp.AAC.1